MKPHLISLAVFAITTSLNGNIILTNPSAEEGDLTGWTGVAGTFSGPDVPILAPNITVSTTPELVSDGSFSLHVLDDSTTTSFLLSHTLRYHLAIEGIYDFSADIKVTAGDLEPTFVFRLFDVPSGGVTLSQFYGAGSPAPLSNGFTRRTYSFPLVSSPLFPITGPRYLEFYVQFSNTYLQQGEVYLDNFSLTVVPEPRVEYLLLISVLVLIFTRSRLLDVAKAAERAGAANPCACGTSGISPAGQARMPEASRDT
jgi:hypothetical protein